MRSLKLIRSVVAILAAAALVATPALLTAQTFFGGYRLVGPAVGASSVSDDVIALYVKYVGTTAGKPTVEVAADGNLVFQIAGAADTTLECPVSGALGGIIDVSDSACDTFGEVINIINGSGSNWRAAPGALLASESSNNTLKILAATDTDVRVGKPLYFDNANVDVAADLVSVVVGPPSLAVNGKFWFGDPPSAGLNPNPFGSLTTFLSAFSEKKTSGGTIGNTIVYGVSSQFGPDRKYSETVRTAWSETGGATATENQSDFSEFPLVSQPGERFILRVSSSTSITAQSVVAAGAFARPQ